MINLERRRKRRPCKSLLNFTLLLWPWLFIDSLYLSDLFLLLLLLLLLLLRRVISKEEKKNDPV
jgi:hypothetical protein